MTVERGKAVYVQPSKITVRTTISLIDTLHVVSCCYGFTNLFGAPQLTIRLCEGRFVPQHDVTIGVEFGSRIVNVGPLNPQPDDGSSPQKRMKLSLWDTAGQETYKSITRSYFRGASGALLVFDITRRSTFESVTAWLHDLRQIAEDGIVVVLVGNKRDLCTNDEPASANGHAPDPGHRDDNENQGPDRPNKRAVTSVEAQEWCQQNNVLRYVETSAKSGAGVEAAFLEVAESIYRNIEKGRYDLNDRRSGVKGPGGGNRGGAAGGVRLGLNDARGASSGPKGSAGGCC